MSLIVIIQLYVFVLAGFVGFLVVTKVPGRERAWGTFNDSSPNACPGIS